MPIKWSQLGITKFSSSRKKPVSSNGNMPSDLKDTVIFAKREWQGTYNFSFTDVEPAKVRRRLDAAAAGEIWQVQELFLAMTTDARFQGIMNSLYSALLSAPIQIEPGTKKSPAAKSAFERINDLLGPAKLNQKKLTRDFLKTYVNGIYAAEVNWRVVDDPVFGRQAVPYEIRHIPGNRLVMNVDPDGGVNFGSLGVTMMERPDGVLFSEFHPAKIILLTDGTEQGFYNYAGVARRALAPWLTKLYTTLWWNQLNETFGEPIRVAFVPPGQKPQKIAKLQSFLQNLGRWMYGIFDDDVDIDFINQQIQGNIMTYSQMIDLANDEMAIAIHGQVQTSDGGKYGSYGKAQVQFKVRREVIEMVNDFVIEGFVWIISKFLQINIDPQFDPDEMPIAKSVITRAEDKQIMVEVLDKARTFIDIPKKYAHQMLEIPEPAEGEDVLSKDPPIQLGFGNKDNDKGGPGAPEKKPGDNKVDDRKEG